MRGIAVGAGIVLSLSGASGNGQLFWINEFHYDNVGTDSGEFVEVAVPAGFAELGMLSLSLYNGGDGAPYGNHPLDTFARGSSAGGRDFYSKLIPGLQNGSPDGLVLTSGGSVVQFLSYEGSFTASAGPAAGLASVDIGVAQPDGGAAVGSSLGLIGTGTEYADFQWATLGSASRGDVNEGQAVVPEPGEYALVVGTGLGTLALWRSWRRRRGGAGNLPAPATLVGGPCA